MRQKQRILVIGKQMDITYYKSEILLARSELE